MKVEDIITLTKAGFSKDDIMKLAGASQSTTQDAQKPAQDAQKPEQVQTTTKAPETPQKAENGANMDAIQKSIQEMSDTLNKTLKDTLNANFLNQTQQKKPESVDDIIASIINPPVNQTK